MQDSINFKGLLYAKNRRHLSKPIMCCHHGDAKIIKIINKASKKNIASFWENNNFSFYEKEGVVYLKIETKEIHLKEMV